MFLNKEDIRVQVKRQIKKTATIPNVLKFPLLHEKKTESWRNLGNSNKNTHLKNLGENSRLKLVQTIGK